MTLVRFRGVPLQLHPTFLWLVGGWALWSLARGGLYGIVEAVVGILVLFGSVVVHELGHALVGQRLGMPPQSIVLLPFGGATVFRRQHVTPRNDLLVSLAGPVASILLGVGFLLAWSMLGWHALWLLGFFNVALGVLNLIPAFPMDGGRVVRAFLVPRLGVARANRIALGLGAAFALVLGIVGLVALEPMLVLIAAFMALMQWREWRALHFMASGA